jgi:ABC-type multidrug transport system fused ATPase/permease subunit
VSRPPIPETSRRALWPFLRRQWPALAGSGLTTALLAAADLAQPWPLKLTLDWILDAHPTRPFLLRMDDLWVLAGVVALLLAIALVDALASYLRDLWLQTAGERIVHDLRVALYAHLQRLSLAFHERRPTGDLVTRVTGDVNAVGDLFAKSLGRIVSAVLLLAGMLVVSFALDPLLGLAAFGVAPALAVITFRYREVVKKLARRQRAKEGQIASLAAEALAGMRVIKAFGAERFEHERVRVESEERRQAGIEATRARARFSGTIDLLGALGTALVLVVGVLRVAAGALTPGDLVVIVAYTRKIFKPLREIADEAAQVMKSLASGDRIAEVLAADQVLDERPGAFCAGQASGAIELVDVSFGYEPGRPVLSHLSLRIPVGMRVAVVGQSGAGKSTLAALIARFYDPTGGRVLIDDRNMRDCALAWLREQVGLVLQDTLLFTGSVAENIGYGVTATREQLVGAAKLAGAHEFIASLPAGYDTVLGPRGVGLSGGQRQRIAIARTLLRNPPVLVLDEPTTGLDAESEAQVMQGLSQLMRGRTTILITHSMALARTADTVVVLENGTIVQQGSPEALLAVPGPFRRFSLEQGQAQTEHTLIHNEILKGL